MSYSGQVSRRSGMAHAGHVCKEQALEILLRCRRAATHATWRVARSHLAGCPGGEAPDELGLKHLLSGRHPGAYIFLICSATAAKQQAGLPCEQAGSNSTS